tara:strand:+ start:345 stop:590 length:246 start_codon:yes stop_codon:yes gene_type:complete
MFRAFIKRNLPFISIVVFTIIFSSIQILKPAFLYDKDGSLRTFGIGSQKKTILPIWLLALILAILSYIFVLYCIAIPKMLF